MPNGEAKKYVKLFTLLSFLLFNFFIWTSLPASGQGRLLVAFLDVGQGDAIFIEAPNGNQVLIDGGPNKNVLQRLSEVMAFSDREIDVVIATHPDKDHIGGLPAVLEKYKVSYVIEPGVTADTGIFRAFKEAVEKEEAENIIARRGMEIDLGSGVVLVILHPNKEVSSKDNNDASIVAMLIYGNTSVMLTGDAGKHIEYEIFYAYENIQSDILKVGHHGSKTSTSDIFVEAVSPSFAIISAGKNNSYGHPANEVLDVLGLYNIEIFETSKEGTISFISDGENFRREDGR